MEITEKQHSVRMTKGMNGAYSWDIKIYFDDLSSPYKVIKDIKKLNLEMLGEFNSKKEVKK